MEPEPLPIPDPMISPTFYEDWCYSIISCVDHCLPMYLFSSDHYIVCLFRVRLPISLWYLQNFSSATLFVDEMSYLGSKKHRGKKMQHCNHWRLFIQLCPLDLLRKQSWFTTNWNSIVKLQFTFKLKPNCWP